MIRGVLLDIGGVIFEGEKIVPGAAEAIARLHGAGLPVRYLTNTTRKPVAALVERLRRAGIGAEPDEIFAPARAAVAWLKANGRSAHLLIHPDLAPDFADAPQGLPEAVVVGDAGPFFTYERLNEAFRRLMAGADFLALAVNRRFVDADGELSLDAGAFVRALEYGSEREALVLGKPAPAFFEAAARSMGCAPGEVAMVGDDAEADVAGALAAGLGMGVLVRTGKYRAGDEERVTPRPSAVVADLAEAVDRILA
ncbi:MAG: TIGR01458 family HAD-type hydrolase [Alphaproteobacteria bacterium]|nr:MAG: TIGR01458 family HAD-type hydrolase [Alphaproteobacteria bacterium]